MYRETVIMYRETVIMYRETATMYRETIVKLLCTDRGNRLHDERHSRGGLH